MFKKAEDVAPGGSTLLKNKDMRKLKQDLEDQTKLSKDDVNEIFPAKVCCHCPVYKWWLGADMLLHVFRQEQRAQNSLKKCKCTAFIPGPPRFPSCLCKEKSHSCSPQVRFPGSEHASVASLTPVPSFAIAVYLLWQFPHAFPRITIPSEVSSFVLGGADLMLPGVTLPQDMREWNFNTNDVVSIVVEGNPAPFAVGVALMSASNALSANMRGKGVRIVHMYGDQLWKTSGRGKPNKGFKPGRIYPIQSTESKKDEEAKAEGDEGAEDNDGEAEGSQEGVPQEDDEAAAEIAEQRAEAVLTRAFLQALRKGVKDRDLPVLANTFFASTLLPSRPPGTTVDLKLTKWKKLGNFLSDMQEEGLIKMEDNDGVISITEIDRSHSLLREFTPMSLTQGDMDAAAKEEEEADATTEQQKRELGKPKASVSPLPLACITRLSLSGQTLKLPSLLSCCALTPAWMS